VTRAVNADLSGYTMMTREEISEHVYMVLLLSYGRLPQLKGKGRVRDADEVARPLKFMADRVADRILAGNAIMMRGPPAPSHTSGRDSRG
jgi:hypothetical protein